MLLTLIKVEKGLCLAGMAVSGALLVALVLMSGCNVAMRVAGHPVSASYELSSFFGALIAALALADTQRKRGHVELDLFTRKYSEGARRWVGAFNVLAGAVLMVLLGCQLANRAATLLQAGEVSETLKFPYPWLMYGAVFGFILLSTSFLIDFALLIAGYADKNAYAKTRAQTMNRVCDEPNPEP